MVTADGIYPPNPPTDDEIRRTLIRTAAWGSPDDWHRAVMVAKGAGWTFRQVDSILFWYHPATWMWLAVGLAFAAGCVFS